MYLSLHLDHVLERRFDFDFEFEFDVDLGVPTTY